MKVYTLLSIDFLLMNVSHCRKLDELNVCKKTDGQLYCCFNYELKDGKCVECVNGYSTKNGDPCTPCESGQYGYRCASSCNCRSNQRCDHIFGECFDNFETVPMSSYTVTNSTLGTIQIFSNQSESENTTIETCLSDQYLLIMGIAIFVLLLYTFGSHIARVVMFKRLKNNRNILAPGNEYDEIGTVHYDAVSISPITDGNSVLIIVPSATSTNRENNVNLENDNSDDNSKGTESFDSNERCIESTSTSNDEGCSYVNELPGAEIIDEYMHPYNSLVSSMQNENPYRTLLINRY